MTMPTFPAGHEPSADEYAALLPIFARKTVDETVTTSTTLQNDDELFAAVSANCTYEWVLFLDYNSGTTADIKIHWTVPSGATMLWVQNGLDASATTNTGAQNLGPLTESSTPVYGGTGGDSIAIPMGILIVSSTAGTLQLQWAQNSSSGSTIVRAGSHLRLRRVA